MPGFNGTGPMGYGPRTGGGFGYCPPGTGPAPYQGAYPYYGVGRGGYPWGGGRGRAWGGGRGWGWGAYPYPMAPAYYPPSAQVPGAPYQAAPGDELAFMQEQAKGLQAELDSVRKRIEELEKEGKATQE